MIAEAVDTALTLGWALAGWIITLAVIASMLTLAAIATGAWTVRAAWRRATGPSWRRGALRARIYTRTRARRPQRHTAPWVHTQPLDYEEAA